MVRKRKLPEVPKLAGKVKGPVSLVWLESANEVRGRPTEVRAVYSTFDEAMLQAFGDRRPGRLEVCPTCGSHVAGVPSGHGLVEMGYKVLRVEDADGQIVWAPKGATTVRRQRRVSAREGG